MGEVKGVHSGRLVLKMDPSPYAEQRYKDGLDCARRATQYDKEGQFPASLSYYDEAVEALTEATCLAPVFAPIMTQVDQYSRRANDIRKYLASRPVNKGELSNSVQLSKYISELKCLDLEFLLLILCS